MPMVLKGGGPGLGTHCAARLLVMRQGNTAAVIIHTVGCLCKRQRMQMFTVIPQ